MRAPVLFLLFGVLPALAGNTEVTFNRDVLPILQNRCQTCHRPGEAAPMSLLTYKDARPWAASMRQAVLSRQMPPWHADPAHGNFSNERRLSDAEIETIATWARTGAAEGDPKDAPPPKQFTDGWKIGTPDVILDMGVDYKVPATGAIAYTYFVVPTGFKEDKWVEKVELRPKARAVVHHALLFARVPGSKAFADVTPGTGFAEQEDKPDVHKPDVGEGQFFGLDEGGDMEMIGVYVPGGDAYITRPGQARLIKAGSSLVFQMHYTANGKEAIDRTRVGIVFAKKPPTERVVNTFVLNPAMHIPPQEPNHRIDATLKLYEDVKVLSVMPHMHLRGKAMEYRVVYPTGETQVLCYVPHYDFHWQMIYQLAQPILLPKGTTIMVSAWYDNSPNNPANPDPKVDVYWGDQSWDEMLAAFMDFAIPVSLDTARIAGPPAKQNSAESAQSGGGQ